MRYLAATLQEPSRMVEMIEVRGGPVQIAARLARARPRVVGFSLIFQCFLPQFRRVARALRKAGVTSHFTIGGHYPSSCHDEVLAQMPELDSAASLWGEYRLVDLVARIATGEDWRQGVSQELNWALDEFEIARRLAPGLVGAVEYCTALKALTAASNEELFRLIEESSLSFEQGNRKALPVEGPCNAFLT